MSREGGGKPRASDDPSGAASGVERRRSLRGSKGWVGRVAWSRDGQRIAVPSMEGALRVWDMSERAAQLRLDIEGSAYAAAFSTTGRLVAAGGEAGSVHVWSVSSGQPRHHLQARAAVFGLAFSPDRTTLAAACGDGVVRVWSTQDWGSRHNLEGDSLVTDVAFSPVDRTLACAHEGGPVVVWEPDRRRRHAVWDRPAVPAYGLCWSPDGRLVAGGFGGGAVAIWDARANRLVRLLEGAAAAVGSVSFSADGRMLAASSIDGAIRVWSTVSWAPVMELAEEQRPTWLPGVAFHPSEPWLAVPTRDNRVVEVWSITPPETERAAVRYSTAKIVLLGDAHTGKSTLGHRLVFGEFKEYPSTHGQQVWPLDALRATREDGTEQEALLWDLAGQRDYRLLHTLYVGDADVVLVVFDASKDEDPLSGARYWLQAVARAGAVPPPVILVSAKIDQAGEGLSRAEIDAFCAANGVTGGYVATSAVTGEGVAALLSRLRELLHGADPVTSSTTEIFRRVKETILALKARGAFPRSLFSVTELRRLLGQPGVDLRIPPSALSAALGNLIKHGHLEEVTLGGSSKRILVRPELLYNTAASLVVLARRAPRGLGAVDEAAVLASGAGLAELPSVSAAERAMLLDAAVRALLDRAVCTRDSADGSTLLVFPELVYRSRPPGRREPPSAQLAYRIEGAVENLFAVLSVRVGYADFVTRSEHFRDEVEYSAGGSAAVTMRSEKLGERSLRLTLQGRGAGAGAAFDRIARLVERLLLARDVAVERFRTAHCAACGEPVPPADVERLIREGLTEIGCPRCPGTVPLPLDTKIDSREWEGSSVQEDKAAADRRQHFQRLLSSLKERVAARQLAAPRCALAGDVSSDWARRWIQDLTSAGAHLEVTAGETATTLPPGAALAGALWLRVIAEPTSGSEGAAHAVLPPGAAAREAPRAPAGTRVHDFREPDRYFSQLLDLLFDLYGIPLRDRFYLRHPVPEGAVPGGGDRPSSSGARRAPKSVVYVHAQADADHASALQKHAGALRKRGVLELWGPGSIRPGEDERKALSDRLATAHVVVVLLSADLLEWKLYEVLAEHLENRRAALVPVLVREMTLASTPFEGLRRIPADGSLAKAPDPDAVWARVVRSVLSLVEGPPPRDPAGA